MLNGNAYFDFQEEKNPDITGITRRLLFFPCNTVAEKPNPLLSDVLKNNCIPIVMWGLASTLEGEFLLDKVQAVNEILWGKKRDSLRAYVLDLLASCKEAFTLLGAKTPPPSESLFYGYRSFCLDQDYEWPSERKFGEKIMYVLRSLKVKVVLKRNKRGMGVKGIKRVFKNSIRRPSVPYVEEMRGSDLFEMPRTIDVETQVAPIRPKRLPTRETIETEDLSEKKRGRGRPRKGEKVHKGPKLEEKRGRPRQNSRPEEVRVEG